MSAWSRSLYLDLAQQLACGAVAVNEAAGGDAVFNATNDYTNSLITIVCQLNAANNVLGGAAVGIDVTNIPASTQTLACLTQALATATGTGSSVPFGSYDMFSQWNAIVCALNQIAENTGQAAAGGLQGGSIYAYMSAAICSMNQIAGNGFGSVPPAPTGLVATPGDTIVDLAWDSQLTADSFNVYRGTSNGGPYTGIATGILVNSYHDTGRTNGVTYYYVVTAVNGAGESAISNQASAIPVSFPDFWYDASLESVGAITTMADISGHGKTLTTTGTVSVSTTQNALNVISFAAISALLTSSLDTPTARTVIIACSKAAAGAGGTVANLGGAAAGNRFGITRTSTATSGHWIFSNAGVEISFEAASLVVPKAMCWASDNVGNANLYYDGALVTAFVPTDTSKPVSAILTIGASTVTGAGSTTPLFFELRGYDKILSAVEIAIISAELATKWAL